MNDMTCCVHGDVCKLAGRIRRRVMHRVTREVNKGTGWTNEKDGWSNVKDLVQEALTDVLSEELK